jgi:hypothetical protein
MGLSPEEEAVFAAITYDLERRRSRPIPWSVVCVAVAVVGVAVLGAWLSGLPGSVVEVFCLAFVVALTVGLSLLAFGERRSRRLALRVRGRRRAADTRHAGR